ncbi:hypothetical protein BA187_20895 [Serratia marcescens]|nr:hypothetical protein BA187_20895 [Serratia marcescens]
MFTHRHLHISVLALKIRLFIHTVFNVAFKAIRHVFFTDIKCIDINAMTLIRRQNVVVYFFRNNVRRCRHLPEFVSAVYLAAIAFFHIEIIYFHQEVRLNTEPSDGFGNVVNAEARRLFHFTADRKTIVQINHGMPAGNHHLIRQKRRCQRDEVFNVVI